MLFFLKILISAFVIAFASWLTGRNPRLAGFLVAVPLVSILTIIWTYAEFRDMEKINQLAISIVAAVPLSLAFFLPFFLNRWWHLNFGVSLILGLGCLALSYLIHRFVIGA